MISYYDYLLIILKHGLSKTNEGLELINNINNLIDINYIMNILNKESIYDINEVYSINYKNLKIYIILNYNLL